jgi:lipoprotein
MKKIFLSLAVLATVALVSCGGKKAEATDSDSIDTTAAIEVVEETTDTTNDTVKDTTVAAEAVATETPAPAANAQ